MSEPTASTATAGGGILTPPARAVSGLALAVMGLFGQNLPSVGLQALVLGPGGSGDLALYYLVMGLGSAALSALALLLVSSLARGPATGWPAHVARATVVVALVGIVGALLIVVGGLVHGS
ncbi:hypothetical protein [Nocardioides euryhalodurans]|uniref:Uncharacterized protein n=1 Tax=Nocardioides euryhalodurans TaxID=2518370 RepID=A0A4P7GN42_9ACTN|nr:hypothetical protein [Nocardioides euryhalodurans]QBR93227.1 hypothetical protein EXE57_13865 [Nocardioides euryhalodurans]